MKVFATGVMKGRPLDSVGPYIIKKFKGQDVAQFRNGAMAYFEEVAVQEEPLEKSVTPSFILPPGIPHPVFKKPEPARDLPDPDPQILELDNKKVDWRKLYHPSYMPAPWLYGAAIICGSIVGLAILRIAW